MALVLDTGPIYSSIDRSDPDHGVVVDVLRNTTRPHYIVPAVLVEVHYWLRKLLDASAFEAFAADVAGGRYELVDFRGEDVVRAAELGSTYRDADLGFVDASIVAAGERLDVGSVLTFDRRHFAAVRPAHRPFLDLVP